MSRKSMCTVALGFGLVAISNLVAAQTKLNLGDALVVQDLGDIRYWKMDSDKAPLGRARYPADLLRVGVSGCVALGFFIEADGSTSGYRVLQSNITGPRLSIKNKRAALAMFSKAALESLVPVRYVPGPENPSRRRAYAYIPYSYSADINPFKGSCLIPDLPAFLNADDAPAIGEKRP